MPSTGARQPTAWPDRRLFTDRIRTLIHRHRRLTAGLRHDVHRGHDELRASSLRHDLYLARIFETAHEIECFRRGGATGQQAVVAQDEHVLLAESGCNALALVGLIGAVKVYNKWNSGDPDTGKIAAAWFGSCVFLVVVATVIRSFFGV